MKISTEGLIEAEIRPRRETYYLVTEENIKSIRGKNILTDIFIVLSSVFWGAYFSVLISRKASYNLSKDTLQALDIYQNVFLIASLILTIIAVIFLVLTYLGISSIKKMSMNYDIQGENRR